MPTWHDWGNLYLYLYLYISCSIKRIYIFFPRRVFNVSLQTQNIKSLSPFSHLFHTRFYKRIFPISRRTILGYFSDGVWDISMFQATDLSFNSIFHWNPTEGAVWVTWSDIKLNWVNLLLWSTNANRTREVENFAKMIPLHRACVITEALQFKPTVLPIRPEIFAAIDKKHILWYLHFCWNPSVLTFAGNFCNMKFLVHTGVKAVLYLHTYSTKV